MLRLPIRLGLLALTLALLAGLARAATPAADAQAPPPLPRPPITLPSLPPIEVPPLTAFDWGIHANGWHVCLRNSSPAVLSAGLTWPTDNVAERPESVAPHSDVCTLRGEPSIYGGPANVAFNYYFYGTGGPFIVHLVSWYPRGTSPGFDFGCDWAGSGVPPTTCTVVRGTMQQPIFVIFEWNH
jgi:hypothetical protein